MLAGQHPVCVPRGMLEVGAVTAIRRLVLVSQRSRREVARPLTVSRNTVKRYVEGESVGVRKPSDRARLKSDAVEARAPHR